MTDTAALEPALVRHGWETVDLLGQLDSGRARRMLGPRWEAERARAAATLVPLTTGPGVGARDLRAYEGPSVQTRFRRTLDFVRPGDRVFEIGPGRGYLAGLLLRDGQAAAYRGVDLSESNLVATRELLELNGLADRGELKILNLYDLTPAEVGEFGADLLVCCEVIEHVPDPEQALRVLAAALPAGADLLISVPLLGRLEDVWGHLSIFDAARIRNMVEDTGLVIHHVEAVDNIWAFVLASHDPRPSRRAAQASAVATAALSDHDVPRGMHALALDQVGPGARSEALASHGIELGEAGVTCRLVAGRTGGAKSRPFGGIRFPAAGARGLRVELAIDSLDDVTGCYVDAYSGDKRVSRWKWDPVNGRPSKSPATFVIRPGRKGWFKRIEFGPVDSADAIDLSVAIKPGASVSFQVTRAALVV